VRVCPLHSTPSNSTRLLFTHKFTTPTRVTSFPVPSLWNHTLDDLVLSINMISRLCIVLIVVYCVGWLCVVGCGILCRLVVCRRLWYIVQVGCVLRVK